MEHSAPRSNQRRHPTEVSRGRSSRAYRWIGERDEGPNMRERRRSRERFERGEEPDWGSLRAAWSYATSLAGVRVDLMQAVVAPENMRAAWARVKSNKGAPGSDGMPHRGLPRVCAHALAHDPPSLTRWSLLPPTGAPGSHPEAGWGRTRAGARDWPFDRYCRMRPLVFSLVPRSQA